MLFFGWGTKTKKWNLGNGYQLLCVYKYFHIWFVIRFITEKRWYLLSNSRSEDREISAAQVAQLLPSGIPQVSAYGAVGEIPAQKTVRVLPPSRQSIAGVEDPDDWVLP